MSREKRVSRGLFSNFAECIGRFDMDGESGSILESTTDTKQGKARKQFNSIQFNSIDPISNPLALPSQTNYQQ